MLIELPERTDIHSNPSRFPPAGKIHLWPTDAHRSLQWVRNQGGHSCQTFGHQQTRVCLFFFPLAMSTPDLLSLPPLPGTSWHLPQGLVTVLSIQCRGTLGVSVCRVTGRAMPTGGRAPRSHSFASTRGSKILTIGKGREGSPLVSDARRSFVS